MPPRHKPDVPERERARQALALRTQGLSYAEIARRLNYRGEAGPRRAIDRLLSRREHEAAATLRQVEGQRLDEAQAAIWPKVLRGDLGAVRELVRIMERRSRLYGLDSPQRVAIEGISAEEFAAQAAQLLAATGPGPLYEIARLPAPPRAAEAEDDAPWSNIGPDVDVVEDIEPDYADASARSDDQPKAADNHADESDPEPEVVEAELVDEPEDDGACCGDDAEPEVIVPTAHGYTSIRRVPAAAVWRRRVNPYAAFRGSRP